MARILGLDLGSYSIKAVVLDTADRAQPVKSYFEVARSQDLDRAESLKAALTALREQHQPRADQTIIALPGPALATHTLTLPFTDAKRIEAALPFEVEGQLPFELNEVTFDYQVVDQSAGKSDVLVAMIRRPELDSMLELLASLGFDPRAVQHPAMAYQNLWLTYPDAWAEAESAPMAILDIGHERTSVAIGNASGHLEAARTFAGGGKDLTRVLASELQVSLPQANHWKETQGRVGSDVPAEHERGAVALRLGLQPILRELRATLKAYTARTRRHVARIYLCGGTSRLPGLAEQLSKDVGIPTEILELPQQLKAATEPVPSTVAAEAYTLALRGQLPTQRAPRFNLRRGDFAFKGHYDYLKVRVARLSIYAAALLFLFVVFGVARNTMLSGRETAVDEQLCKVTQQVLGRCEKNYDRALNMLKGKESPTAAVPKVSAVNILSELTSRIPSDVSVTLDQIQIDPERVTLRGITDSSKQVDRITQSLKAFRCFHEVQVGKLEKTKDDHVTFRLEIQVDCPDQPTQASAG